MVLQNEWTHLSRIVPNVGPLLAPIEEAIREKFIPALFGFSPSDLTGEMRYLLSLSVKQGGLAIRHPVEQAPLCYETSRASVDHLVETLVDRRTLSLTVHCKWLRPQKAKARETLAFDAVHFLTKLEKDKPGEKRRLERIREWAAG